MKTIKTIKDKNGNILSHGDKIKYTMPGYGGKMEVHIAQFLEIENTGGGYLKKIPIIRIGTKVAQTSDYSVYDSSNIEKIS